MSEQIRRLPDAELEVMQAVWDCQPPVPRQEIEKRLFANHPMAVTTLLTLLTRLAEKRFLRIEKIGRGKCYTPLIGRQAYLADQSRSFLQKLCCGSLSTFATALCDSGLSKDDLAELRTLLEEGSL